MSYFEKEFHSQPTKEFLERYISLYSHSIFFFNETIFHIIPKTSKNRDPEYIEDDKAAEGPDDYLETETMDNVKLLRKHNEYTDMKSRIYEPLKYNPEIMSGYIKTKQKSNKLITLIFNVKKSISLKKVDYKNKLSEGDSISTVGMNLVAQSSDMTILDLFDPMQYLELVDVKIFLEPSKKITFDNMYKMVNEYYENSELDETYSKEFIIDKCNENSKRIYK